MSFLDDVRSWAFVHDRKLWGLFHELKSDVKHRTYKKSPSMPEMNRRMSTGNLLVVAMLKILKLREDLSDTRKLCDNCGEYYLSDSMKDGLCIGCATYKEEGGE